MRISRGHKANKNPGGRIVLAAKGTDAPAGTYQAGVTPPGSYDPPKPKRAKPSQDQQPQNSAAPAPAINRRASVRRSYDKAHHHKPTGMIVRFTVWMAIIGIFLFAWLAVKKIDAELKDAFATAAQSRLQQAELISSRIDGQLTALRSAMLAATDTVPVTDNQQDAAIRAAESALNAARSSASGVAIIGPSGQLARVGDAEGADWLGAFQKASRSTDGNWLGVPDNDNQRWSYTAVPTPFDGGKAMMIAATSMGRFLPQPNPYERVLVADKQGRVLSVSATDTDGSDLNLESLLGVSGALLNINKPEFATTETTGGQSYYVSLAPAANGTLLIGTGLKTDAFQRTWRMELMRNMLVIIGPLMIAALLAAFVWKQAKSAESAKRAWVTSEKRFRAAVEAARAGVWEWDFGNDVVYLSDVMAAMIGMVPGRHPAHELMKRIAPQDQERVQAALRSAQTYGAFDASFRVLGAKERYVWINARAQSLSQPTQEGHFDGIVGVALDITEEKLSQARAEAAEVRLRDAIENVREAFAYWDVRGRLVIANNKLVELFSLDPKVLKVGASFETVTLAMASHVTASQDLEDGIKELQLKSGRWVRWSERHTSDGGVVGIGSELTDIKHEVAERQRREQALEEVNQELVIREEALEDLASKYEAEKVKAEDASRAKSEFLANMSHELRTPLNAINGFSEIMQQELFGPLGDPRYKDYLNDILASGKHLLSLINDILDMSKIEAGKLDLKKEPLYIDEIAEDCMRVMRQRAEAAEVKLISDFGGLPEVEADYRAIKQIILNLLSNAVKFTPENGRVILSGRVIRDFVVISVTDTGIGIAKDDINKLAKPFSQIENQHSKTYQGTGLGLALSKSLIELHGGNLKIDSELGRGTVVSFTLPRLKVEDEPMPQAAVI